MFKPLAKWAGRIDHSLGNSEDQSDEVNRVTNAGCWYLCIVHISKHSLAEGRFFALKDQRWSSGSLGSLVNQTDLACIYDAIDSTCQSSSSFDGLMTDVVLTDIDEFSERYPYICYPPIDDDCAIVSDKNPFRLIGCLRSMLLLKSSKQATASMIQFFEGSGTQFLHQCLLGVAPYLVEWTFH